MCDCELPKAFKRETRKARKAHLCCECRSAIQVGESYEFSSGVWDYPDSFKTCLSCADVRREMEDVYECCIAFGKLREEISENSFCGDYGLSEFIKDCEQPAWKYKKLFSI